MCRLIIFFEDDIYMIGFEWEQFYERFTKNYEEFDFYYKLNKIAISTGGYGGAAYLSYGNNIDGFITKDYLSPIELLNDRLYDGHSLPEIWDLLE